MKHPIRNTMITLAVVAGLLVGGVAIAICDFTDNTPDYISEVEGKETGEFLGDKAKKSLTESGALDDYKYVFSEHELNDLFATIVPSIAIPGVNLKSMYIRIEDDNTFQMEAPFWALFYKSCAKGNGELIGSDDAITIKFAELKVNLLSSKNDIVKNMISDERIQGIEDSIKEQGFECSLWKDGVDIYAKMTREQICQTIVNCCEDPGMDFLVKALDLGLVKTDTATIVVNDNGQTGIVIHRSLLLTKIASRSILGI